jgi:hypothetical protein
MVTRENAGTVERCGVIEGLQRVKNKDLTPTLNVVRGCKGLHTTFGAKTDIRLTLTYYYYSVTRVPLSSAIMIDTL